MPAATPMPSIYDFVLSGDTSIKQAWDRLKTAALGSPGFTRAYAPLSVFDLGPPTANITDPYAMVNNVPGLVMDWGGSLILNNDPTKETFIVNANGAGVKNMRDLLTATRAHISGLGDAGYYGTPADNKISSVVQVDCNDFIIDNIRGENRMNCVYARGSTTAGARNTGGWISNIYSKNCDMGVLALSQDDCDFRFIKSRQITNVGGRPPHALYIAGDADNMRTCGLVRVYHVDGGQNDYDSALKVKHCDFADIDWVYAHDSRKLANISDCGKVVFRGGHIDNMLSPGTSDPDPDGDGSGQAILILACPDAEVIDPIANQPDGSYGTLVKIMGSPRARVTGWSYRSKLPNNNGPAAIIVKPDTRQATPPGSDGAYVGPGSYYDGSGSNANVVSIASSSAVTLDSPEVVGTKNIVLMGNGVSGTRAKLAFSNLRSGFSVTNGFRDVGIGNSDNLLEITLRNTPTAYKASDVVLAAGASDTQPAFSVPGATPGKMVAGAVLQNYIAGLSYSAVVSSNNAVTVTVTNTTGSSITIPGGSLLNVFARS